ncbi:MAG TPA: hypothetical protein VIM56_06130 [Rhizomicrobium sp.]
MKALRSTGAKTLLEYLSANFEEVSHPSAAQFADLAWMPGEETGEALGIFVGEMIRVVGATGANFVPRTRAVRAFKIT